ncbi:MAG: VOC family virulence protein [Sneathiella sp.]|jgi:catechol 2,3-dioxygenase-like lactoylglutathione lyase family enzyme|uniref:VOC family protein n=1 Tax=Sneathiella sp. TaxID=1964365 RepID=UPI000C44D6F2|nr:VOC family protein [Sneathiella sp.]MAL80041.1 VOC family virulence protein [Sneathiella sp.]|tara:strand:- start:158 stop:535 length:378 start_codon:yes stop_codon:yes gene_type:complete
MIKNLDHFVLTVVDIDKTKQFYCSLLGMTYQEPGKGRRALHFGASKINLHLAGHEFEPKAHLARPGTADLCFIIEGELETMAARLEAAGVSILMGPVVRTGARGPITSIYVRDPDLNLIELSVYE